MEQGNIYYRKLQRSSSEQNLSVLSQSTSMFDATMMSLPDALNESQNIIELNSKIEKLTLELQSAHQEIDDLNNENLQLKQDIEKYQKTIEAYKKVNISERSLSNKKSMKKPWSTKTPIKIKTPTLLLDTPKIKDSTKTDSTEKKLIETIDSTDTRIPITSNEKKSNSSNYRVLKEESYQNNSTKEICKTRKKNIIVFADQQGQKVREILQKLIGPEYNVVCYWKPGAKTYEVLNWHNYISNLTENDYIIILTGTNDCNPSEFLFNVKKWCKSIKNTNFIITEIPYNRSLNEKKLNYELRFMLNNIQNINYVDMDYSRNVPHRKFFTLNQK